MAILISKTKDDKLTSRVYGANPDTSADVTFGRGALEKVLTKLGTDADDTAWFGKGDSGAIVLDGQLASSKILDVTYTKAVKYTDSSTTPAGKQIGDVKKAAKITVTYIGKEGDAYKTLTNDIELDVDGVLDDLNADITSDDYETLKVQVTEDHGKLKDVVVSKTDAESKFTDKTADTSAKFEVTTDDGFALGSDLTNLKSYVDAQAAASKTVVEGKGDGDGVTVESTTDTVTGQVTYKVSQDLKLEYHAAAGDKGAYFALEDNTNSTEISTIQVSDIIGNGVLTETAYDETTGELTLTFATADGKNDNKVVVDLGKLLDIGDIFVGDDSAKYLKATTATTTTDEKQVQFDVITLDPSTASETATGLADSYEVKKYVDAKVADLNGSLDADVSAVGTNVSVGVTEEDGVLTKVTVTEKYATVESKKEGDADTVVTVTDETALVTGKDIATLADFSNTRISEEVAKLDSTVTVEDASKFVKVVTGEVDGKLDETGSSVSFTHAVLGDTVGLSKTGEGTDATFSTGAGTVTTNGIVTADELADKITKDDNIIAEALNVINSSIKSLSENLDSQDGSIGWIQNVNNDFKKTVTDTSLGDIDVSVKFITDTYSLYLNGEKKDKEISVVNSATIGELVQRLAEEKARAMAAESKLDAKLTWIEI